MPRPRFDRLPEERKAPILEAAARAFAADGFDDASLNRILAAAGLSKGAAYYYFDDKADLFAAVVRHYLAHILAGAHFELGALTRRTFWPKIFELQRQAAARARSAPELRGLAKALWRLPRDERDGAILGPLFREAHALLAKLLVRGQALGVVRRDLPGDLLIALVFGLDEAGDMWMAEHIDGLSPAALDRITAALFTTMRRVVAPVRGGR